MKHYTDTIPYHLAEKLKEKGMLIANVVDSITGEKSCRYTYAHIFDWMMEEKGIIICFDVDLAEKISDCDWSVYLVYMSENLMPNCSHLQGYHSWHEAANAAIEKALELI